LDDPPITQERAEALLLWMVRKVYLPVVVQLCPGVQEPGLLAALIDFTFNLGSGRLKGSNLRRVVNAGQVEEVPRELANRIIEEHKAERHGVAAH
jgi:lysozyme